MLKHQERACVIKTRIKLFAELFHRKILHFIIIFFTNDSCTHQERINWSLNYVCPCLCVWVRVSVWTQVFTCMCVFAGILKWSRWLYRRFFIQSSGYHYQIYSGDLDNVWRLVTFLRQARRRSSGGTSYAACQRRDDVICCRHSLKSPL